MGLVSMTFTSEERREVAEKLRHASHTDANLDVTIAIAILDTIGEVHRPIAAVVADLIDPTCTSVLAKDKCSVCGEPLGSHANYCPKCGSRVVDDE